MNRVTTPIVLGVSAVFGLGLLTAVAANSTGAAVSHLAKASQTLTGEARGDAASAAAKTEGRTEPTTADATTADASATGSNDSHGDAVSAVARDHTLVAAQANGAKKSNHGGVVSLVARKR